MEIRRISGHDVEFRRVPGRHEDPVVIMHGGHFRAELPLGEDEFTAAGLPVLVPSRPGYGMTATAAGPGPVEFAETTRALLTDLGIRRVHTVVGISAGGPSAVALAEALGGRAGRLLLVSARSPLPFPTGITRAAAGLLFSPAREARTWGVVHRLVRTAPALGVRAMMASLSTVPLHRLTGEETAELAGLFGRMRSGAGFDVDVHEKIPADLGTRVACPTLVVHSRHDAQVGPDHARRWLELIPGAEFFDSPARSHLLWFGAGSGATRQRIAAVLRT